MKKQSGFFIPLMGIVFLVNLAITSTGFKVKKSAYSGSDNWEKLGETKVNQSVESDEIIFPAKGPVLSAIKIRSKKGGINLQRCIIHFANGDKKSIELRNDIPPGGESRVINLPGNKYLITKFTFWYGTPQSGDQKAELEIWGKV
jgi:hypothetical protein